MNIRSIFLCGLVFVSVVVSARDSRFTRHGAGPLYWMAYEQCFVTDSPLAEDRYQKSVDWVAKNFLSYGYDMVCTDGWIERAQTVNENGYITKYNDAWSHDFAYWIDYNKKKGLKTGIYYDSGRSPCGGGRKNCIREGAGKKFALYIVYQYPSGTSGSWLWG